MRKILIIILCVSVLSAIVILSNRDIVLTEDEVVTKFLTIVFTNTEEELEWYYSDDHEDYMKIYNLREEKVRSLLTPHGLEASMMSRSLSLIGGSQMTFVTEIDNIQLDFRETSEPDELVCYYLFDLIYEEENQTKRVTTGGNMLLIKVDETWRIDTFIHSFRDLMKKLRY